MGDKTGIEWTDATWNPVRGCTKVSAGCDNCYAMTVAHRFSGKGQPYENLTRVIGGRGQWNGKVMLVEHMLDQPLRWKKPRRIFVNSMSDLFHPGVPDEFIDRVFAVMALAPRHTFQILTKRPERMREYLSAPNIEDRIVDQFERTEPEGYDRPIEWLWPLSNVWLGVSVEDQATANERIPLLLDTPAAVRWVSCEPLLGPVDLNERECLIDKRRFKYAIGRYLDWVVVGGESGPGSRPMHPDWARSLRDQCLSTGVAFLFKQWGDWVDQFHIDTATLMAPQQSDPDRYFVEHCWPLDGQPASSREISYKVGKHKAGRHLDGKTWDQYPEDDDGG